MNFKYLKYCCVIISFFICSCVFNADTEIAPKAVKGILDLSNWDFDKNGPVDLSGEYAFYWRQLIYPQDFLSGSPPQKSGFIVVPGFWHTFKSEKIHAAAEGYATYRLRIIVNPSEVTRSLAIKYLDMGSAFQLFLNGEKLCAVGTTGITSQTSHPMYDPGVIDFQVDGSSLDLIMQVSNFHHRRGGAWQKLSLGKVQDFRAIRARHINYDVFLFGSIFVMAIYHLVLFLLRRQEISSIFFSAFCLLAAIRILTTGERYLMELFPAINWQLLVKLEYLSYYLAVPAFTQFVYHFFPNRFSKKICTIISITGLIFSFAVILLPVRFFSNSLPAYHLLTFVIFIYALYVRLVASLNKELESIIFLAGFFVIFLTAVNDILNNENIIQTGQFIPLGLFLFIFSQAFLQSLRFSRAFSTVDSQRQKLREMNQALQSEIADRLEVEKELRESHKRFVTVLDSIDADVYAADMQKANEGLEKRVDERTAELLKANEQLHLEIEEREQAQEHTRRAKWGAEKANKAKSEFLANMSHELRTPLGHIIGFTELVLDNKFGELNEVQSEFLNDVLNSSNHLLSLINDILDLSKVESGKLELQPSSFNLKGLLENSLIMVKEKALKQGIKLSNHLNGIPDTITADERKLKQIIYNLLSNAVKFTPDGGKVSLTARTCEINNMQFSTADNNNNGAIEISVTDTGIGLNSKDFDRIFCPFEQAEGSRSRKFQGTGLGLSLTKNLVKLHGGRIWVDSEGENKGSTFSFIIPVTSPESSIDSETENQKGEY